VTLGAGAEVPAEPVVSLRMADRGAPGIRRVPREKSHRWSARVDTPYRSDDHHAHPLQAGGPHARHTDYGQPSGG
jgi:hypothetical protein